MPLMKGTSPDVISENIREMVNAGHPQDQAVAASYRMAGKGRKKKKKHKAPMPPPPMDDQDEIHAGED